MGTVWQYQVRINLGDVFAKVARTSMADPVLQPLATVLTKHNATLVNQFDAFANFCAEAEARGDTNTDLYIWTKATIDKPGKEAQYATRFTVHASGNEVYDKAVADAVEADLLALVGTGLVTKVDKFDTNPARNPQPPSKA